MTRGFDSSPNSARIPALVIFLAIQLIFWPSTGLQAKHSTTTWNNILLFLSSPLEYDNISILSDLIYPSAIHFPAISSSIIFSSVLYLTDNDDVEILKNFHLFFVENSNILKQISEYNNNIIESYSSTDQ